MNRILLWLCLLPAFLLSCDCKEDSGLLPGETNVPGFRTPIVVMVEDSLCSDSTKCPSNADDCVKRAFTVQKDTMYYMSTVYYNGDTLTASCRSCATVFKGDEVVMNSVTACPTGGPWRNSARLIPGETYTLSLCLQACPDRVPCDCGEMFISRAIITMRFEDPVIWPPW